MGAAYLLLSIGSLQTMLEAQPSPYTKTALGLVSKVKFSFGTGMVDAHEKSIGWPTFTVTTCPKFGL